MILGASLVCAVAVIAQDKLMELAGTVRDCRDTLEALPRETPPQERAKAQHDLANALQSLALYDTERHVELLKESVKTFRAALTVYTREAFPQEYALVQNDLGDTLKIQMRGVESKEERLEFVNEAIAARRAVLTVYTREASPQEWAKAQYKLGGALEVQDNNGELLGEAVNAYRAALTVYTPETDPKEWVATQGYLAQALESQANCSRNIENMRRLWGEAIVAHRATLMVYTREASPEEWASRQYKLGYMLDNNARLCWGKETEKGVELREEVIAAYRAALTVYTREKDPRSWVATQIGLGGALKHRALIGTGAKAEPQDDAAAAFRARWAKMAELLGEAAVPFRAALTVYTLEADPYMWASAHYDLGDTLRHQALATLPLSPEDKAKRVKLLNEAVASFENSVKAKTQDIEFYQEMLDKTREELAEQLSHLGE